MAYLFSLIFQGQMTAEANVSKAEQHDVERQAFPSSPPRDAAIRDDFRAFKIAPLEPGRLLVSVAAGGRRDPYGRPVLRATGCVLETGELTGALRDVAALWETLEGFDVAAGFEAFKARVSTVSFCTAPEAFHLLRSSLVRYGDFYAELAKALGEEHVDLYLGPGTVNADLIRPAFGLLPLRRLRRLHLVLGAEPSEYREPVLGLAEDLPPDLDTNEDGLFERLLKWRPGVQRPIFVDFQEHKVVGAPSRGPRGLAEAITDPRPWPDGLTELGRYQVLLQCLDGPSLDGPSLDGPSLDAPKSQDGSPTPFDLRPELDELRQAVGRLEALSRDLKRWR